MYGFWINFKILFKTIRQGIWIVILTEEWLHIQQQDKKMFWSKGLGPEWIMGEVFQAHCSVAINLLKCAFFLDMKLELYILCAYC